MIYLYCLFDYLYHLSNDYNSCQALLIDSLSICISKAIDNNINYKEIKDKLNLISKSELLKRKPNNIKCYSLKEKIAYRLFLNGKFKILYSTYKLLKRNTNG